MENVKATKPKRWVIAVIVLITIFLIYIILSFVPLNNGVKVNPFIANSGNMPMLIAHGGGNGEYPDNTFEGFCNAYNVRDNVMLETDVSLTKDGVLLITHDTTPQRKTSSTQFSQAGLSNTTQFSQLNYTDLIDKGLTFNFDRINGLYDKPYQPVADTLIDKYRISSYAKGEIPKYSATSGAPRFTYQDIATYTGNERVAYGATTLEDLIRNFPNSYINAEIKQSGEVGVNALNALIELITKYNAFDRVVAATNRSDIAPLLVEKCKQLKKQNIDLMFSPGVMGVASFMITQALGLDIFFTQPISVLQVPQQQEAAGINVVLATKNFVQRAHRHNVAAQYWTVNNVVDYEYLCEINCDGIMTDIPTRLLAYYNCFITSKDYPGVKATVN